MEYYKERNNNKLIRITKIILQRYVSSRSPEMGKNNIREKLTNNFNLLERKDQLLVYVGLIAFAALLAGLGYLLSMHPSSGISECNSIALLQSRYTCLYHLAYSTKNASVCSFMQGESSVSCYTGIASLTSNPLACRGIENQTLRYQCISGSSASPLSLKSCMILNGSERSSCTASLAITQDNLSLCSKTGNGLYEKECESAIYLGMAAFSKDVNYCNNISNTTNQSEVLRIISLSEEIPKYSNLSVFSSSLTPISYIESGSGQQYSARDLCYFSVSEITDNQSSCNSINTPSLYNLCVTYSYNSSIYNSHYLNESKNYSSSNMTISNLLSLLCSKYNATNSQSCNYLVQVSSAVVERNASICGSINSTLASYQCYASLAQEYNDSQYCGYITNSTLNQACVGNIYYNGTN